MPPRLTSLIVALLVGFATLAPDVAAAQAFVTAADLDLTMLLAPPPEAESREARAELGRVLAVQTTRTPEMEQQAVADGLQDVSRFADALGLTLPIESLPKLRGFFARIEETEEAVTDPAKAAWRRPRPHQASDLVRPVGRLSQSASYPSGHATLGTLMGIVLGDMVPERRAAMMRRARQYGYNRVVAGNHFPSDVEAGRLSGTAIAALLFTRDDFRQAFVAAKAELRAALELPQQP